MVGGYQIIDLTKIDLNGGDIPASAMGKDVYDKLTSVLYSRKPVVFRFRNGQVITLMSNYEIYSDDNGNVSVIYGDKKETVSTTTALANYNSALGIKCTPDGAISIINQ